MSDHPCGTPAGMMMMSPTFTCFLTTSLPIMKPLQDGPFKIFVTSASGPDLRPFTMCPPVTTVPAPDVIREPSVCDSWYRPLGVPDGGGVAACSPHGAAAAAAAAGAAP